MQIKLCKSGANVLDAAGFTSTQAVRNACQLEYVHAFSFYIGNRYGVTKQHFQIAFDNGKLVSPNREGDSHEAYSWASGPVREIDQTRLILDSFDIDWRNVPTIDSAVDWNPSAAEIPRCDDWWHQYVDYAQAVGFWGGYYGATNYGKRLVQFDWWPQDFAIWTWGGSGEIPNSNMKQWFGYPSGNDYSSIGVTVDESTSRGLWMASSFDAPIPPDSIPEADVPVLLYNTEPYPQFKEAADGGYAPPGPPGSLWPIGWIWFERMEGGAKRWLSGERYQTAYDWNKASGFKGTPDPNQPALGLSTGRLQSMPDYVAPMTSEPPHPPISDADVAKIVAAIPPGSGLTYDQAVKAVVEGLTKTHGDATMTFTLNP